MDLKKLAPWNWFRNEEEDGATVPVSDRNPAPFQRQLYGPIGQLHQEIDQMFDNFFRGSGLAPFRTGSLFAGSMASGLLKPTLDIGANEKEYTISIEVPGVEQKDLLLEIVNNTLTVRGEKKQKKEKKEKDYYRMECSYGSFQRVLSLPEDADQDDVKAAFKNGVLTITISRKALPESNIKQIEIK